MLNMDRLSRSLLYFRLIKELFRYDLMEAALGFQGVRKGLKWRGTVAGAGPSPELEAIACEAVSRAVSCIVPFYWKRVQCLQRSVVTTRVLRAYGAQAETVIGYTLAPLLAHAWVEVSGRVVNDSPEFQRRLQVLDRF